MKSNCNINIKVVYVVSFNSKLLAMKDNSPRSISENNQTELDDLNNKT